MSPTMLARLRGWLEGLPKVLSNGHDIEYIYLTVTVEVRVWVPVWVSWFGSEGFGQDHHVEYVDAAVAVDIADEDGGIREGTVFSCVFGRCRGVLWRWAFHVDSCVVEIQCRGAKFLDGELDGEKGSITALVCSFT